MQHIPKFLLGFVFIALINAITLPAQTPVRIKDIMAGPKSSSIGKLHSLNGLVYFSANDSIHGQEPWVSDGTEGGTTILRDIAEGTASSSPSHFHYNISGRVYFAATQPAIGRELHRTVSNGGSMLLKDINPNGSSNPEFLCEYNGASIFIANDGVNGVELWSTDGLTSGTNMLFDLNPNGNAVLDFAAIYNGNLFFIANEGVNNYEIWVTDEDFSPPTLLKNIAYIGSSNPTNFLEFNGLLYFTADDGNNGNELWVTDGTPDNTVMFADITPGPAGTVIANLTTYSNRLYFQVGLGIEATIWSTDGTQQGTVPFLYNASGMHVYNNKLVFTHFDTLAPSLSLWISDGTLAGSSPLKELDPGNGDSESIVTYKEAAGLLYMISAPLYNTQTGHLWVTDGTANGTVLLTRAFSTSLMAKDPVDVSAGLVATEKHLFFVASLDTLNNYELYSISLPTAVTAPTTAEVLKLYPNPTQNVVQVVASGNAIITSIRLLDVQGKELWAQDFANGLSRFEFNSGHLSSGLYILQAYSLDGLVSVNRFVKE